jgi:hypothetical protein
VRWSLVGVNLGANRIFNPDRHILCGDTRDVNFLALIRHPTPPHHCPVRRPPRLRRDTRSRAPKTDATAMKGDRGGDVICWRLAERIRSCGA